MSSLTDENTVLATNGGSYTITNAVLGKSGNCSNNDNSNFYAVNAILAVSGNSSAYISGTKLTSSSEGSNALFATGSNSKIYAKDVSINTTGNSARGLDATYEGTIIASDINITTKGNHCPAGSYCQYRRRAVRDADIGNSFRRGNGRRGGGHVYCGRGSLRLLRLGRRNCRLGRRNCALSAVL